MGLKSDSQSVNRLQIMCNLYYKVIKHAKMVVNNERLTACTQCICLCTLKSDAYRDLVLGRPGLSFSCIHVNLGVRVMKVKMVPLNFFYFFETGNIVKPV